MGKLNKIIRLTLTLLAVFTVAGYAAACSPGVATIPIATLTEAETRAITDPVAENIFQAMNTGNYTAFTRDFDATLKGNQSEDAFNTVNAKRTDVVGKYISKEFWMMTQKTDKLTVAYRAKFTLEPADVTLTVMFKNFSGQWLVDGLIYDSPLMRNANC